MDLYKRFLLVVAAVVCAAGAVCGVLVAKANTERRLLGPARPASTAAIRRVGMEEGKLGGCRAVLMRNSEYGMRNFGNR